MSIYAHFRLYMRVYWSYIGCLPGNLFHLLTERRSLLKHWVLQESFHCQYFCFPKLFEINWKTKAPTCSESNLNLTLCSRVLYSCESHTFRIKYLYIGYKMDKHFKFKYIYLNGYLDSSEWIYPAKNKISFILVNSLDLYQNKNFLYKDIIHVFVLIA